MNYLARVRASAHRKVHGFAAGERPAWWNEAEERELRAFLRRAIVDLEAGVVRVYDREVDFDQRSGTASPDRAAPAAMRQRSGESDRPAGAAFPSGTIRAASSTLVPARVPGKVLTSSEDKATGRSPSGPSGSCPSPAGAVQAAPESRVEVVVERPASPPSRARSATSPARGPAPKPARRARSQRSGRGTPPPPHRPSLADAVGEAFARAFLGRGRRLT